MAESTLAPLVGAALVAPLVDVGTARAARPGMGGMAAAPWRFTSEGPHPIWLEFWIYSGDTWGEGKRAKGRGPAAQRAPTVTARWRELVPSLCVDQVRRELARLRRTPRGGPSRFAGGRLRKPALVRVIAGALADWGASVGAEEIARVAEVLAGEHVDRRLIVRTLEADGWLAPWTHHHFARYLRLPQEPWAPWAPKAPRPAPKTPRPHKRAQRSLRATARALAREAPNAR